MSNYELPFKLDDPSILHFDSFVNNEWVTAKSGERFEVIDPATTKPWTSISTATAADIPRYTQTASRAFTTFRTTPARQRAQLIQSWDTQIRTHRSDLARILVHETGKPLAEALGEIDYALTFTWWFVGEAERITGTITPAALPGRRVLTIKQPVGVVAALVPWNFPVAMVVRKAAAALAAGCTMIVKPSPETPVSALVLGELAKRAGFPAGVFNVVTTDLAHTPSVSEALCRAPEVRKVTFTGSTRVGKLVAGYCADGLRKMTLELGGNCPFVVFDDADLDQALGMLMALKWRHAGQACIAANRVYVQAGVYERFVQMLTERTQKEIKVGRGWEEGVTMGAMTTPQGVQKAVEQVQDAVAKGATLVLGGDRIEGEGYFFPPTILKDMTQEMRVSQEESFAPIAAVYRFETEEEAVRWANDTAMGLASYAFTKNADRLWRLFENLEAGMIGLNTGASSAAEAPFGGVKESGYGKESGKEVAVNEYLVTKTGTLTVDGHY
ncbi:NAD-dependent succinate-semialdehyde dehydrogenase [Aspergillus saccharolyticus JOP 1030-1]|uniref:Succinate-semialdehyde dehydrogenase [NADP+] n=1 Tax=Aspergillus saccharolyticus JOP 1030-1 TaxID=1450539 RepID=A0A318Z6Z7_9EURO|nr:succinate-semialdehyde dehydrogenase [NADP+] [Aspergillus saccharolyticus JOP 1030-1]PYH42859.1 succinate-semialdehyde dehydrogenase [NADP+] [Aspergillus saccharolyticus JOP 1030-1]